MIPPIPLLMLRSLPGLRLEATGVTLLVGWRRHTTLVKIHKLLEVEGVK
jgi:hypothetical protein